jgi:hypothetical protein
LEQDNALLFVFFVRNNKTYNKAKSFLFEYNSIRKIFINTL